MPPPDHRLIEATFPAKQVPSTPSMRRTFGTGISQRSTSGRHGVRCRPVGRRWWRRCCRSRRGGKHGTSCFATWRERSSRSQTRRERWRGRKPGTASSGGEGKGGFSGTDGHSGGSRRTGARWRMSSRAGASGARSVCRGRRDPVRGDAAGVRSGGGGPQPGGLVHLALHAPLRAVGWGRAATVSDVCASRPGLCGEVLEGSGAEEPRSHQGRTRDARPCREPAGRVAGVRDRRFARHAG